MVAPEWGSSAPFPSPSPTHRALREPESTEVGVFTAGFRETRYGQYERFLSRRRQVSKEKHQPAGSSDLHPEREPIQTDPQEEAPGFEPSEGGLVGENGEGGEKKGKKKKKKKTKDAPRTPRAVETMFRTSYRTHLDLSNLADNKANIMISINGIIISILLASIYPRVTENRWILLPTAVLLVSCVLSLVYAVLSARPRVTRSKVTLEDVQEDRANILFFGNFVNMKVEDFTTGMRTLIRDPERAYGNMIRDIYYLGLVLEKKYRLLRISYTIFMLGLSAGVGLFLVVFFLGSRGAGGF